MSEVVRGKRRRNKGRPMTPKRNKTRYQEFYNVEGIVDRRVQDGNLEYLVKWEGYPASKNSWVGVEDLNEGTVESVRRLEQKLMAVQSKNRPVQEDQPNPTDTGYHRGDTPEEVLGVKEVDGVMYYIVKWKDFDLTELVPRELVGENSPQMLITFYERVCKPELHVVERKD